MVERAEIWGDGLEERYARTKESERAQCHGECLSLTLAARFLRFRADRSEVAVGRATTAMPDSVCANFKGD